MWEAGGLPFLGTSQTRYSLKLPVSSFSPGTEGWWLRWLSAHFWQDPDRNRRVGYVNRNPDNRKVNLNYADNRFNDNCVIAGVRRCKPLYYLVAAREFPGGDITCRSQPPSIRPISSNFFSSSRGK